MTKGEVYEFLNAVRTTDLYIIRLQAQKRALEACLMPSGIRYDKDKVMSSPEDQLSKICADISVLDNKIALALIARAKKIIDIQKGIDKLTEEDNKAVLTLCYIERAKIDDIAGMLGYSADWVYKKRRKGIEELMKIL